MLVSRLQLASLLALAALAGTAATVVLTRLIPGRDVTQTAGAPSSDPSPSGLVTRVRLDEAIRQARERVVSAPPEHLPEGERGNPAQVLDTVLADLEQQARARGAVTALEVEPGMAAIDALEAELPPGMAVMRRDMFAARMAALSAELDGRAQPRPPPELPSLSSLEQSAPGPDREALVRQYLAAVDALPLQEQQAAMARLHGVIAPAEAQPSLDERIEQLGALADPGERESAVQELSFLLAGLPETEQRRYADEIARALNGSHAEE